MIEGTVKYEGSRDVYIAAYIDGVKTDTFPSRTDYTYDAEQSNCTNEAILTFDEKKFIANVGNVIKPNTKCSIYFNSRTAYDNKIYQKMIFLEEEDNTQLAYDGTKGESNLRYIGANPNNYIEFNNELWRIIGTFKDIDDGTGVIEWRTKIIREESIGDYSWNSSDPDVNDGWGINEWSQADIMKLLNPGYSNEPVGGSLYWNRTNGSCYNNFDKASITCDFSTIGLTEESKNMIGNATWNLGSNGSSTSGFLPSKLYELERSNNTGKICSSGTNCNDTVTRTTTWTGKVGLMYPSDYGYAVGGSIRNTCLNTDLKLWKDNSNCYNNTWIFNNNYQFTLTPYAHSQQSTFIFLLNKNGSASGNAEYPSHAVSARAYNIRPTLFLSSNVYIVENERTGAKDTPYQLALQ